MGPFLALEKSGSSQGSRLSANRRPDEDLRGRERWLRIENSGKVSLGARIVYFINPLYLQVS